MSADGDLDTPTSCIERVENGKVMDMQELYHRINSQALTFDTEADEEVLIHLGSRTWELGLPQDSPNLESKTLSVGHVASSHTVIAPCLDISNDTKFGKNFCVESHPQNNMGLTTETPSKEFDMSYPTSETVNCGSISRLSEDTYVGGRDSLISGKDASGGLQIKDCFRESVPGPLSGSKGADLRACKSVARPRVLCLEHAVEAQEQLQSVGGARVLLVCHPDFEDYELRAKDLAQEFGIEHTWVHVPFSKGADDEVNMVSTAVNVEDDDGQKVSDWVAQMGLFVHRFRERESESSDDAQNVSEDFRAGPFSTVKPGKQEGSRQMAGRVNPRLPRKTSKKKQCVVAGRWCGRVWRVNQVHPLLGGCRKVDPSLQLGMSSTSLYALSMMSGWDGGKTRKAASSTRNGAHPDAQFSSGKGLIDQQSVAVQRRNRKRKMAQFQLENTKEEKMRMAMTVVRCSPSSLAACTGYSGSGDCSLSPKKGAWGDRMNISVPVDHTVNGGEILFLGDGQSPVIQQGLPQWAYHPDADGLFQSPTAGFRHEHVQQMVSPTPLASHDPSTVEERSNHFNKTRIPGSTGPECVMLDKHLPTKMLLEGKEYDLPTDQMKTDAHSPVAVEMSSESQKVTDTTAFGFHPTPSELSSDLKEREQQGVVEAVACKHKPSPLKFIGSTLPARRVSINHTESSVSLLPTSASIDGNKNAGLETPCVWLDVPVACAQTFHPASPSFHPVMSPCAEQFTSQFPYSTQNNCSNPMYIPYVSASKREVLVDHPSLVVETSRSEIVYSEADDTLGSCVGEESRLQDVQLMLENNPEHMQDLETAEGKVHLECPTKSSFCPRSSSNPPDLHEANQFYYDTESVGLTPVPSLVPFTIEPKHQGAMIISGELEPTDDPGQGTALEHPLARRHAVKARGKRAKHVGWRNFKQAQPESVVEPSVSAWESTLQPHPSNSAMISVSPVQYLEGRFEVDDCDRGLMIVEQSNGLASPCTSLHTAEDDAEEGNSEEAEAVANKPKKKGKAKKKKISQKAGGGEDEGEFQCDIDGCRMSFKTETELQIHKRNRCTVKGCGKRFFMHKYLLQHRRVHLDERPLKCPWKGCKQAFKWAWARTEHIRVHTGERPYACPECDQTFRFVSDFSRHKRNTGHTK